MHPATAKALSHTGDTVSGIAIVGTFLGYLPELAGLAGLIWYCVQIWESKTVQKRVRAWKLARRRRLNACLPSKG